MRKTKIRISLHSSTEAVKYFICGWFGLRICSIAIDVCHGSKTKMCTRLLLISNLII